MRKFFTAVYKKKNIHSTTLYDLISLFRILEGKFNGEIYIPTE